MYDFSEFFPWANKENIDAANAEIARLTVERDAAIARGDAFMRDVDCLTAERDETRNDWHGRPFFSERWECFDTPQEAALTAFEATK